jgi:hypothetical protein
MWAHKEGSQPEHKAIEHSEIRRTLSGAIADQELMFEQERFSCDLARAARAEEFREGHEQMDRQEEQIAHELKIIMPANLRKTAPQRRFMPKLPIRHPQDTSRALDARLGTSGSGTFAICRPAPRMSVVRGTPDVSG